MASYDDVKIDHVHQQYMNLRCVFRLHPVTDIEAGKMVHAIKNYKILQGVRGSKPVDVSYIQECLIRLSQLVSDFPELSEIDLNPFIFTSERKTCRVLDARIRLSQLGFFTRLTII
jgi:acyl-CoA synthetase (NDP forming)